MIGAIILAMIYGYLYFQYRYQYLLYWSVAWVVYAVPAMIGAELIQLPFFYINAFSLVATFFLARGTLSFLTARYPQAERYKRLVLYFALASLVWMIAANLLGISMDWQLALTYVFIFLVLGVMGLLLLENWRLGQPYIVLGIPLSVIGLCAFMALFVLPEIVELVVLYMLGLSLPVLAIGMLIAFVDHLRRDVVASQEKLRREVELSLDEAQKNYQTVIEQQAVGVGILDPEGVFTFSNPAAEKIMGAPPGKLVGRTLRDFTSKEQFDYLEHQTFLRRQGQSSVYELSIIQPSGRMRQIAIHASPRFDREGTFVGSLGVFQDVTDQRQTEMENKRLLLQERMYRRQAETLQAATKDLVLALDLNLVLNRVLTNLHTVIPYDSVCLFLYNESHTRLAAVASRGFKTPEKVEGLEIEANPLTRMIEDTSRPVILQDAHADPRFDRVGDADHVHGWMGLPLMWHDQMIGMLTIDSREVGAYSKDDGAIAQAFANQAAIAIQNSRLYERSERMAVTDPLTGLYNRRHLFEKAQHEFLRYQRYGTQMTVVMMDIDHFHDVNNTYGHIMGDMVLREVAGRLRSSIRTVDIIGRYGGEEFMVILTELPLEPSFDVAERLRCAVADSPVQANGQSVSVTLSIGVATVTPECKQLDDVIHRADMALYRAKENGRNCVAVWNAEAA